MFVDWRTSIEGMTGTQFWVAAKVWEIGQQTFVKRSVSFLVLWKSLVVLIEALNAIKGQILVRSSPLLLAFWGSHFS
jgi:hypothetical protein